MPQSAAKTLSVNSRWFEHSRLERWKACSVLNSLTWRIDREALTFLVAGRALLLQLAHPWVAAAIAEHSKTIDDPIGRFHRTFAVVFTMVFGTLDVPCPRPEPCIAATPPSTAACQSPSDLSAPALRIKPTILQRCAGSMPPWLRPRL